MNIRMKTGLVLCAAFLLVVAAVVITSRAMLLRHFAELDEERLRTNVGRATSSLEGELSNLSTSNRDWAFWDDTYEFIVDRNEKYIGNNPVDEGFRNLRLNLMVFVNSAGEVVYSKAYDLRKETEVTPPDIFQRNLSPADTLLLHSTDPTTTVAGILLLPEGPMLITSNPILTSKAEGPIRGTLIWGRYLDEQEIDALAKQTLLSLDIISFADGQSLPNFQKARPQLLEDAIFVGLLSSESIGGYSLIRDIYGKPALILRVDVPREIYHQGLTTVNYFLISIILASLLFGALTYILIDKLVLSRLARLSATVSDIGKNRDLSAHVNLSGNDELSNLADTINTTLGELEAYQQALSGLERKYSTLVEQGSDGIAIIQDGLVAFVNSKILETYGFTQEELLGKAFLDWVSPEYRGLVSDRYKKRMAGEETPNNYEIEILAKDGSKRLVEISASRIEYEGRPAEIVMIRDITGRKQAEEALRASEEKFRNLVQNAPVGIVRSTIEGRFLEINDAILRMHGYDSEEEFVKSPVPEYYYDPKDRERWLALIKEKGRVDGFEVRLKRKDGSIFWASLNSIPQKTSSTGQQIVTVVQDITERKRAEEEYKTVIQTAIDGFWLCNMEGRFLEVNDSYCRMIGYTREELLEMSIPDVEAIERPEETAARIAKIKKLGGDRFETRHRCKDGNIIDVEISVNYMEVGDGRMFVFVRDITERKRAEDMLRESEKFTSSLLNGSPNPINVINPDTSIRYVNPALEKLTGYSHEQVIGSKAPYPWVRKEVVQEAVSTIAELLRAGVTGVIGKELLLQKKSGEKFWVSVTGSPVIADGKLQYQVVNWVDITERKRAEEAIRQSEGRFRNLVENAPVGMIISSADKHVIDVNDALLKMHGCDSKEEFVQWPVSEHYYDPKDRERWVARLREQGKAKDFEVRLRHKDGTIFWASLNSIPQVTESGEQQFVTVIQDITERKQAEEKEKQLQQELILAGRLATVGEMAAGIAHEINNPLTGVVGFAGLLLKKDISEDIRQDVNTIYEGAQRIAGITDRMLRFARQSKPERTQVNINDIIETTLALRTHEMKSSNIEVTTKLAPDLPLTYADAGLLQQVFLNIILNAETAMKEAHGKGNLMIKTERTNNILRVSFKDSGPGIARENIEKIFNPFFTTREVGQGTGLGLSVSYGIVKQHGGKIYARSTLGKGATFFVELPIVTQDEQLKLSEPTANEPKSASKARILVVDDEPIVQDFIIAVLTKEGHKVETVDNGNDALERLGNEEYDVILLDIKLPGISGIQIYKQLQKSSKSLTRKVIFITGDVMGEDTMSFISRAKHAYITKPFDAARLVKEIDRIISR